MFLQSQWLLNQWTQRFFALLVSTLLFLALVAFAAPASAQYKVEIAGIGSTQMPIAVAPFAGESGLADKPSQIIAADLERSGKFGLVSTAGATPVTGNGLPDITRWQKQGADAVITGQVTSLGGQYQINYRVWDVVSAQELGSGSQMVSAAQLRLGAHRVADEVYETFTREPGAFTQRIAYVTKNGRNHKLWVADGDGHNAKVALNSREPIISVRWSPDGTRLAYVSFETRKPVVYVHNVTTGQRRAVANFKGSNSAPAWSPDGSRLVVTLTRDGRSQLYSVSANGGAATRLTRSSAIDTEGVYSPDGGSIYFVSDRGGSPQIYRMPASGGKAQRITFNSSYSTSPAISPDGKWLAYISRDGGFKVNVQDLTNGQTRVLSSTRGDEKPSFSANGRMVLYATKGRGGSLMVASTDGAAINKIKDQGGVVREPNWSWVKR